MPKSQSKSPDPDFLAAARAFYGPAFAARTKADLAAAMADWAEMDEDEQRFAVAHLHYLHLQAEAGTQRLLRRMIGVLEEVADNLAEALDASGPVEESGLAEAVGEDDEEDPGLTDAQAHALARGLPVPDDGDDQDPDGVSVDEGDDEDGEDDEDDEDDGGVAA